MHFDLPAEPLADALDAYMQVSGQSVMAQTQLLNGRTSAPVSGDFAPHDALRRLFAGTGLAVSFTGEREAVVLPSQSQAPGTDNGASAASPTTITASDIDGVMKNGDFRAYAAMVQTRLTEALCASPLTRPGHYRLVAQLRIGADGTVVASKLVSETGVAARDAAIARVLRGLKFDAAPPAGLAEPLTILLRPPGSGVETDCWYFNQGESVP
ncbi:MAG TPA: secretin and TonB N-terminal domain-containing protein [Paraburkholderia sp.]|jgi:hypothetical protein